MNVCGLVRLGQGKNERIELNPKIGDLVGVYKYLGDPESYARSGIRGEISTLKEQIRVRLEEDLSFAGEELLAKAEIIAHKVSLGFREV
ncbi:MAG: hypothetical protein GXO14_00885 [Thermococci archaeon]|nr:hypothetical protein [Thermococci archaeon]